MPHAKSKLLVLLLSLGFLVSCAGGVHMRRYAVLPEDKIAALAEQIEDIIVNTRLDEPGDITYRVDANTGQPLGELDLLSAMVSLDEVREKVPALNGLNMNDRLALSAIRGRILRRPAVDEFKQNGCLGENIKGLVQYLGSRWCSGDRNLKNRAAYIALSENRDRRAIYKQIIEANNLDSSASGRIRELFVQQIFKKLRPGTPFQLPDGTWKKKQP